MHRNIRKGTRDSAQLSVGKGPREKGGMSESSIRGNQKYQNSSGRERDDEKRVPAREALGGDAVPAKEEVPQKAAFLTVKTNTTSRPHKKEHRRVEEKSKKKKMVIAEI